MDYRPRDKSKEEEVLTRRSQVPCACGITATWRSLSASAVFVVSLGVRLLRGRDKLLCATGWRSLERCPESSKPPPDFLE